MILQRLVDLRERVSGELIPPYHKEQRVSWILSVSSDGEFEGFVGAEKPAIGPSRTRSGTKPPPYLLVDKAEYVLGLPVSDSDKHQTRAAERHSAYRELVEECAAKTGEDALKTYLTFLQEHTEDALSDPHTQEMDTSDLVIPRVGGVFPTELEEVRQFWIDREDRRAAEESSLEAECIVCGEEQSIARTHPLKFTVGSNHAPLVTGNKASFLSYGLEQSENAPVCQPCARAYGEGLRYLLQTEKHHLYLAGLTWVYWTREPVETSPFDLFETADEEEVENLLESVYRSHRSEADAQDFYAMALSSIKGRVIVRSVITSTVTDVKRRLARYFERQRLDSRDGEPRYHGVYALAGSLVPVRKEEPDKEKPDYDKLPPQVLPQLVEHALIERPLPLWILHQAVRRARAEEHTMTHPRAALIKLVLLSQPNNDTPVMEQLKEDHPSDAYQCGRLLALLENIERKAIDVNTTLVDRYYGTASTAPASIFGTLVRGAQPHLSKLRRDSEKKWLYHYFDKELSAVMSRLEGFPKTLSAEEQGLFALGYYQQRHRPSD